MSAVEPIWGFYGLQSPSVVRSDLAARGVPVELQVKKAYFRLVEAVVNGRRIRKQPRFLSLCTELEPILPYVDRAELVRQEDGMEAAVLYRNGERIAGCLQQFPGVQITTEAATVGKSVDAHEQLAALGGAEIVEGGAS